MEKAKRLWTGFWQLADPKVWVASTVPMFVGASLAFAKDGTVHAGWFLFALIGVYLIEIGKNATNEYVDYVSGVDRYITADRRNPFSGGKKTIVDGKLLIGETFLIALLTLAAAFLIGIVIVAAREPAVLGVGLLGVMIAAGYSLPPLRLNYNGLGEIAVGLAYGPLILLGIYVLLTGEWDWWIAIVGIPLACLIANVLWINQYPDYEADLRGGKRNGLVRIGLRTGLKVYGALFAGAYLSLAALALWERNPYWLLGWLTVPLAFRAVRIARSNIGNMPLFLKANATTVLIYLLVGMAMIIAVLLGG